MSVRPIPDSSRRQTRAGGLVGIVVSTGNRMTGVSIDPETTLNPYLPSRIALGR